MQVHIPVASTSALTTRVALPPSRPPLLARPSAQNHKRCSTRVHAAPNVNIEITTPKEQRSFQTESGDNCRLTLLDEKADLYGLFAKALNCGGAGQCGTCIMEVTEGMELLGKRTDAEQRKLKGKPDTYRLACQTKFGDGSNTGTVKIRTQPKDRGCLYYVPWISSISMCILGGAMGVFIHFSLVAYDNTKDGLKVLSVDAANFDISFPAVVACAAVTLGLVVILGLLSLVRSFIEAAHDATGFSGSGSSIFMWLSGAVASIWWLVVLFMSVMLVGTVLWAGLLAILEASISGLLLKYGPNSGQTQTISTECPSKCLNFLYFAVVKDNFDTCICDYSLLRAANKSFDKAYSARTPALVGVWISFLATLVLLVNFACQYSHTKREKELIARAHGKQFESTPNSKYGSPTPYAHSQGSAL